MRGHKQESASHRIVVDPFAKLVVNAVNNIREKINMNEQLHSICIVGEYMVAQLEPNLNL